MWLVAIVAFIKVQCCLKRSLTVSLTCKITLFTTHPCTTNVFFWKYTIVFSVIFWQRRLATGRLLVQIDEAALEEVRIFQAMDFSAAWPRVAADFRFFWQNRSWIAGWVAQWHTTMVQNYCSEIDLHVLFLSIFQMSWMDWHDPASNCIHCGALIFLSKHASFLVSTLQDLQSHNLKFMTSESSHVNPSIWQGWTSLQYKGCSKKARFLTRKRLTERPSDVQSRGFRQDSWGRSRELPWSAAVGRAAEWETAVANPALLSIQLFQLVLSLYYRILIRSCVCQIFFATFLRLAYLRAAACNISGCL